MPLIAHFGLSPLNTIPLITHFVLFHYDTVPLYVIPLITHGGMLCWRDDHGVCRYKGDFDHNVFQAAARSMCIYIYIYIYIYMCTYIYIYIYMLYTYTCVTCVYAIIA